jgi:hypothetical protein
MLGEIENNGGVGTADEIWKKFDELFPDLDAKCVSRFYGC